MGLFEQLPYTNFHELNLTEVIKELKRIAYEMEQFKVINKITYRGTWDITKQYPAWSVVASTDGTIGYISIQPVPVGVDLINTDYWALVADFTVQLAGLGGRVTALENDNVNIHSDISNLQTNLGLTNSRIKSWAGHKILWVGDSYGNGWNGTATLPDKPYVVASNLMGCSYVDISVGGSRFGTSGGATYQYKTHIEDYVNNHSDMNTFTDVIIIGGANDINFNPTENLSTPIQTCVNYVKANFPNATIHIGMVARLAQTGATNCTLGNVWNMTNQYRTGAINNGVHYIEKSELINHDYSLLATDGIHLTSYIPMGTKLASLLMSGDFERSTNVAFSATRADTNNDNLKADIWTTLPTTQVGTDIIIDISDIQFNFSPAKSIVWKKTYKIAKISGDSNCRNLFAAGAKSLRWTIPAAVDFQSGGKSYNSVQPFTIFFYDNYLWLSWEGLVNPGGVTMNATSIYMRQGIQLKINENYC